MNRKKINILLGILALLLSIVGLNYYNKIFSKNVIKTVDIYIKSTDNLNDVIKTVSPFIDDVDDFKWVANKKRYYNIKAGKYTVKKGMSANALVNLLRSGRQNPIVLSFNNQDSLEKLAGRIAKDIEPDSISLLNAFKDSDFLAKNNLTEKTALQIYLPNSYELYWNTSAKRFRNKMLYEYNAFWNKNRLQKAANLNLSKTEVSTLASIVQKETAQNIERPIVAGLYLNRLKRKIPLQADPTVIYAIKEKKGQDFEVKRVLLKDLELRSPYNTYRNRGLPPSLIAMPDISSIEAVLNPAKHNYIYMCVDVDNLGFHAFASSLRTHNKNAAKYHRWLSKQGINR